MQRPLGKPKVSLPRRLKTRSSETSRPRFCESARSAVSYPTKSSAPFSSSRGIQPGFFPSPTRIWGDWWRNLPLPDMKSMDTDRPRIKPRGWKGGNPAPCDPPFSAREAKQTERRRGGESPTWCQATQSMRFGFRTVPRRAEFGGHQIRPSQTSRKPGLGSSTRRDPHEA